MILDAIDRRIMRRHGLLSGAWGGGWSVLRFSFWSDFYVTILEGVKVDREA